MGLWSFLTGATVGVLGTYAWHLRKEIREQAEPMEALEQGGVTPGFNRRVTIKFTYSSKGKLVASYWGATGPYPYSPGSPFGRWLRMKLGPAIEAVATGQADLDASSTAFIQPTPAGLQEW